MNDFSTQKDPQENPTGVDKGRIRDTSNPNGGIDLPTVEVRELDMERGARETRQGELSGMNLAAMNRLQMSNGYGRMGMGEPYSVDPANGRFGEDESKAPPAAGLIGKAQDPSPLT